VKKILCEKPIVDLRNLKDLAMKRNLEVAVNQAALWNSEFRTVKERAQEARRRAPGPQWKSGVPAGERHRARAQQPSPVVPRTWRIVFEFDRGRIEPLQEVSCYAGSNGTTSHI